VHEALGAKHDGIDLDDMDQQGAIFSLIAGEFMGTDRRRGRTYTWLIDHLADAFHETTPRSFLIALQRAATTRAKPQQTVIDHHGIREGVQAASTVRVDQLGEDYPWIQTVLGVLEGLEVPCKPDAFIRRWKSERKGVSGEPGHEKKWAPWSNRTGGFADSGARGICFA
jgi:hypothetical protein